MISYSYKKQGDGRDSWTVTETDDNGQLINRYMVYEDPTVKPVPNVDVIKLLQSLSPEEITQIKQILQ